MNNLKTIKKENLKLEFNSNLIKYKKPRQPPENCLEKKKNYEIKTYIPIKISMENQKLID
jgi:hypothetical protein